MSSSSEEFTVKFSYKGKSTTVECIRHETTATQLIQHARQSFEVDDDTILRLLFKGKTIAQETLEDSENTTNRQPVFPSNIKIPKSGAKVIVMGTAASGINKLNSQRSDPLMRGFEEETRKRSHVNSHLSTAWGQLYVKQNKHYKFCRFKECTDASFGSRPGTTTPHAFEARRLLEKLACDPGIQAVIMSRRLVVGTLGEMDPIDDRLMQQKASEGACLLGYNTNFGSRIDIKLRTDDLSGFRSYPELVSTLIHELSHNWCGDHDVLFWTNFAQMRIEYIWEHANNLVGSYFVSGERTASIAGVMEMIVPAYQHKITLPRKSQLMSNICNALLPELQRDMMQQGLQVQLVMSAMMTFSVELMAETRHDPSGGHKLGTHEENGNIAVSGMSAREKALAAAEKRAREAEDQSGS